MLVQLDLKDSKQVLFANPCQRGLGFVHAQLCKDLSSLHQVSPSLLLMQIKQPTIFVPYSDQYWTAMSLNGQIIKLPEELETLLGQRRVPPAES